MRILNLLTKDKWDKSSVSDPALLLVKITAPGVTGSPFRLCPNREFVVTNLGGTKNYTYEGFSFQLQLPEEGESEVPRAAIVFSNVDKRFMPALVAGNVGDTMAEIVLVLESDPDTVIYETEMRIASVSATKETLQLTFSHNERYAHTACRVRYSKLSSPGLFP